MIIDRQKLQQLIHRPLPRPSARELRREGTLFFVGGALPPNNTLETVFESHCLSPVDLMLVTFGDIDSFHRGEELLGLLKKNFHVHLMARFDYPVPNNFLERAYAAGADLVDIPLTLFDSGLSRERGLCKEERLESLHRAQRIFPAWRVVSTLLVGEEASCATVSGIDLLLKAGVVPLAELSPRSEHYPREEIESVFRHLAAALKKHRATSKSLLPLLSACTPLVPSRQGGILQGILDRLNDHRLLAASDFRRSLRVRRVEESLQSSGL